MDSRTTAADAQAGPVTRALAGVRSGDEGAEEELLRLVQRELRALARRHVRRGRGNRTLQTTALVNEAYLRLFAGSEPSFQDRDHFLGVAARAMRSILVDRARRRAALRRGGGRDRVTFHEWEHALPAGTDVLDLDAALAELATEHPRRARLVDLRFFAGLELTEVARLLGVGERTVRREWKVTRVWLYRRLTR